MAPALIFTIVIQNGSPQWIAEVANTDPVVSYNIEGENLAVQSENIEVLGINMEEGEEALEETIMHSVEIGNELAEQVIENLFGDTDQIIYLETLIYGGVGDEVILDDLELAGEALALAAAAAPIAQDTLDMNRKRESSMKARARYELRMHDKTR